VLSWIMLIWIMMVWQCKAYKVTSVLSAYTPVHEQWVFHMLWWTLGIATIRKTVNVLSFYKMYLLKYMFTMLNRQTQSKNATLEFTYKEIQLYFVRKLFDSGQQG
jgi:hypothetical protein